MIFSAGIKKEFAAAKKKVSTLKQAISYMFGQGKTRFSGFFFFLSSESLEWDSEC